MKKTAKPVEQYPRGSFAISSFSIEPGGIKANQRFRFMVPSGSKVVSAIATVDHKIAIYYRHDVPFGLRTNFDILVLKEGQVLKPEHTGHRYDMIQSVALDGEIYHLLHHYKVSGIILPN